MAAPEIYAVILPYLILAGLVLSHLLKRTNTKG